MALRFILALLSLAVFFGPAQAAAGPCDSELDRLIREGQYGGATGSLAAYMMAKVATIVEPAFPPIARWNNESASPVVQDPSLRFLGDLGFLPAEELLVESTTSALLAVADNLVQGLGGPTVTAEATNLDSTRGMQSFIDRVLRHVSELVRPAALLVWDDEGMLAMRALVWNWSTFPRLIVFPPNLGGSGPHARDEAIASLENCVRDIDYWVSVEETTARRLFSDELTVRLVVVGTEPDRRDLTPWWVPEGEELDVLAYEHPAVRDLDAFSVIFAGPPLSFTAWLQMLPHVRTNASPFELQRYLQTPPSVDDR